MKTVLIAVGIISVFVVVAHPSGAEPEKPRLVVKEVVLSPRPLRWVRFEGWIAPSEDCRHVAYRAQTGNRWKIVRDGVSDREYDQASWQAFSPDSEHLAYVAQNGDQRFVVLDGVEGKPFSRIVAPTKEQWPFVFSPDSAHLAYVGVVQKGQECVVVDGAQGPLFEEILHHSFSFSEDSKHFTYAARRGGKGIVVKDGKEVMEAEDIYSRVTVIGDTRFGDTFGPFLSPDGTRLACAIRRGTNWFTVIDGVASKPWDDIIQTGLLLPGKTGFSSDGRAFTYMGSRKNKISVMLNHVEQAQCDFGSGVVFSPDNKRTAFAQTDEKSARGTVSRVVLDGVQGKAFEGTIGNIAFSPDGRTLAYTVEWAFASDDPTSFVVVHGGEEFHGIIPVRGVLFSPDSKHMSFSGRKDGKSIVVLDGKELPRSDDAASEHHRDFFAFSPDSSRWAYIRQSQRKQYAVVSGTEYGPYDDLCEPFARNAYIYFSPDSRHFAFQATRARQQYVIVNGVEHEIQGE